MAQTTDLATIAKLLDLTERRVNQLVKENVLPRANRGQYPIEACILAYIKYLRAMANDGALSLTDERTRLTRALAQKAEMDLQLARGDVVRIDEAAALWEKIVMACRSRLLSIPTKAAPLVAACKSLAEIKEEIEKVIHEALNELSNLDPADYHHGERPPNVGAPAKADRQSVGRSKKKAVSRGVGRARTVADLPR